MELQHQSQVLQLSFALQQENGGIVVGTVNTDQQGIYLAQNLPPGNYPSPSLNGVWHANTNIHRR
ncbi:hypothetical protein F6Y02_00820 [Bacillus megaterium]|nr:hypothetical protein [Priestia megaterium]